MRDLETISAALTAAETGHLVVSTLHSGSCIQAIDRMIDVFSRAPAAASTRSAIGCIASRGLPAAPAQA